jgi:EmrB/QacA subfamily drug resistance transporter
MVLLDGSALNVALPAVQRDIHGSMAALEWVVNIYTIPLASVLLTAGSLGDRIGPRTLYLWALGGFTLASAGCAVSPDMTTLIVARALQGLAAGALLPTTLTIIARSYPNPAQRARAITAWGGTGGMALVAGPVGGGLLADAFGWRSIFVINIPVGIVTTLIGRWSIGRIPPTQTRRLDLTGQLFAVATLGLLIAGLIEGSSAGWTSPPVLALLAGGLVLGGCFVVVELRSPSPMLPLAVFRRHAFTASVINGFALQFGGYGMQFMLAIYLQSRWGLDALHTGLLFLPLSICWVIGTAVLARRLVPLGVRRLLIAGAATALAGSLLLFGLSGPASWPWLVAGTLLIGLGCGVFAPSLNGAALMSIEPAFAGLGSGILNTARQVGMAFGVALLGGFIALGDHALGLRLDVTLIALCFLTIVLLSLRYLPADDPTR